ncbi:acyltransferase family protein [Planctobacterium marinum]|uniref:acyltransferase family protein n=1 Tax=Planctobacterium marinum TaxID=1631968 RepID=UPI0030C736E8
MMKQRDKTLDIFRGLTVCFMILVNTPGSWQHIYWPLKHSDWHGVTPTDLVFPFFLFAVGSSLFHVIKKDSNKIDTLRKALKRSVLLFAFGLFLNAFPFVETFHELRIMGVLQRIAICYLLAVIVIVYIPAKRISIFCCLLLLVYWCLVGFDKTYWELSDNLVREIDLLILGQNHMYQGFGIPFEPEGLLSCFPATVSVLFGYRTTQLISVTDTTKAKNLALLKYGIALTAVSLLWMLFLPLNKPLWSSSYVLLTTGLAQILLGVIYLSEKLPVFRMINGLMEIYGSNPLLVYILSWLFAASLALPLFDPLIYPSQSLTGLYFDTASTFIPAKLASLSHAILTVALFYLLSLCLYKKRIFIKI